jgi:hypothetical protein
MRLATSTCNPALQGSITNAFKSADSTTQIRRCSDLFFSVFFGEIELSLQSGAHFSDLIFQERSKLT